MFNQQAVWCETDKVPLFSCFTFFSISHWKSVWFSTHGKMLSCLTLNRLTIMRIITLSSATARVSSDRRRWVFRLKFLKVWHCVGRCKTSDKFRNEISKVILWNISQPSAKRDFTLHNRKKPVDDAKKCRANAWKDARTRIWNEADEMELKWNGKKQHTWDGNCALHLCCALG